MENSTPQTANEHLFPIQCYIAREDLLNAASAMLLEGLASQERLEKPEDAAKFLQCTLASQKTEHFGVLFLNNRNQLIAYELLFRGTVNTAAVHPRVIAQRALELNATSVILAHNHPSGHCEPSHSDRTSTRQIIEALKLLDVKVLDHLIVTPREWTSLSRLGQL